MKWAMSRQLRGKLRPILCPIHCFRDLLVQAWIRALPIEKLHPDGDWPFNA
jgi:hypothetical protein